MKLLVLDTNYQILGRPYAHSSLHGRCIENFFLKVMGIVIDPNYLRAGASSLILKMFADGKRQDTLSDVLRFQITRAGAYEEGEGFYATWISGPLKFHYQWAKIEKTGG